VDHRAQDIERYVRRAATAIAEIAEPGVQAKSRFDLVTDADLAAERTIRALIACDHPADAIVGEEDGGRRGDGATWWIDPLDGTHNFVAGSDRWAISVAVTDPTGATRHAAVFAPARDELFTATRGAGAWCNGVPLRVATTAALADAIVASGFGHRPGTEATLDGWRRVLPAVRGVRCRGSAALDLCDVAGGRIDGYWERGLGPWDTAAGILIAAEAGAATMRLDDGDQNQPPTDLLVSSPALALPLRRLVDPPSPSPAT
jgi:myo-inositol-1(or 4)-monophosphatase